MSGPLALLSAPTEMKVRAINSTTEIDDLEKAIVASAEATAISLRRILIGKSGIHVLAQLKFDMAGRDPLSDRPLNFIEQVNQTFTYLASCDALRYLFTHHPERAPFVVHLGTAPGPDIESRDGALIAEVFAATHPGSNGKLRKDLEKLRACSTAAVRYLFYSCPDDRVPLRTQVDADVMVVPLGVWRRGR